MPLNIFDGSNWNPFKKAKVYDGTTWQDAKTVKVYDGTTWHTISSLIPINTVAPSLVWKTDPVSLSNDYGVGQTVSINTGTWTNNPTSFTYKWYKAPYTSNSTKNWTAITGETLSTFSIPADSTYVGYLIKCEIVAINQYGSSDKIDAPFTGSFITPSAITGLFTTAESNIQSTLHWNDSFGATGYEIQYWQSGVYYSVSLGLQHTWQLDTTNFDSNYGIGILIYPVNNSNPASSVLGGYKVQGGAQNTSFTDIRPNKPRVVPGGDRWQGRELTDGRG